MRERYVGSKLVQSPAHAELGGNVWNLTASTSSGLSGSQEYGGLAACGLARAGWLAARRADSRPHMITPKHIDFIPHGNRRWAVAHGLTKEAGYASGIAPGLNLYDCCKRLGIAEVSVYGFTQDNTRRPAIQAQHFRAACVAFALEVEWRGAAGAR